MSQPQVVQNRPPSGRGVEHLGVGCSMIKVTALAILLASCAPAAQRDAALAMVAAGTTASVACGIANGQTEHHQFELGACITTRGEPRLRRSLMNTIEIVAYITTYSLAAVRLLTASKPLWNLVPEQVSRYLPAVLLGLALLAERIAGATTGLDLTVAVITVVGLVLPGMTAAQTADGAAADKATKGAR